MEERLSSRRVWEHLLSSGGYSIGLFSITVEGEKVRVFHYRTKKIAYFDKDQSYEEMQKLCKERGYDLPFLLNNYYPKSFRSLRGYKTPTA